MTRTPAAVNMVSYVDQATPSSSVWKPRSTVLATRLPPAAWFGLGTASFGIAAAPALWP